MPGTNARFRKPGETSPSRGTWLSFFDLGGVDGTAAFELWLEVEGSAFGKDPFFGSCLGLTGGTA